MIARLPDDYADADVREEFDRRMALRRAERGTLAPVIFPSCVAGLSQPEAPKADSGTSHAVSSPTPVTHLSRWPTWARLALLLIATPVALAVLMLAADL